MSLDYYALYLLLALGTVLSPGPAVIYTIGNTLTREAATPSPALSGWRWGY